MIKLRKKYKKLNLLVKRKQNMKLYMIIHAHYNNGEKIHLKI